MKNLWLKKELKKVKEIILWFMGDSNPEYHATFWPEIQIKKFDDHLLVMHGLKTLCQASYIRDFSFQKSVISIIGSGPSVKAVRFHDVFQDSDVVVLNGAMNISLEHQVVPYLWIIVDVSFARERIDLIRNAKAGTKLLTTVEVIKELYECEPAILEKFSVYITHPCKSRYSLMQVDLDVGYVEAGTVMAVALQLCLQKNAQEIFLFGFDIGGTRFYQEGDNVLKSGLVRDYEQFILPFMKECSFVAETKGIKLYNCSASSLLPCSVVNYSGKYNV